MIIIDPDSEIETSKVECLDYYDNQKDIIPIGIIKTVFHFDIIHTKYFTDSNKDKLPPSS